MKNDISALLKQIHEFQPDRTNTLPQNTFFLNDTDVLCRERESGESRHPYAADGLVVWAHSSGQISACESTLHLFKTANSTEDPNLNFFGGLPQADGTFFPVALQNANRQLFEPANLERYVVYTASCVYYLAETAQAVFALRLHVSPDKHIHLAFSAINTTDAPLSLYLASCIEARMLTWEEENFWDRMKFYGQKHGDNYCLFAENHYLVVRQTEQGGTTLHSSHSAGRSSFLGKNGRGFANAAPLKSGRLLHEMTAANTADMPVAADVVHYRLQAGECVRREYELSYGLGEEFASNELSIPVDIAAVDAALNQMRLDEGRSLACTTIRFDDWDGALHPVLLNRFLQQVQKQVSFCALGKNYAGPQIGIRDVMQQLEVSLLWQPVESREKIITALQYILEDGRPPRQFSVPTNPHEFPSMDLRAFIDQGVWIISTVYTYLCFTEDWSILDEPCSYYIASPDNTRIVAQSEQTDTVLEHILRIADYLGRHLDPETGCLRAMHGDWNDALDGLGKTNNPDKRYGNGVSVMASLQFYQNCLELDAILAHSGRFSQKRPVYASYAKTLQDGLAAHAIDTNADGAHRIVHGWGDRQAYRIGSFHDPDGIPRRSATSTAFWAITDMIRHTPSLREDLVADLTALGSRYGLKTFDRPFAHDMYPYVGRIATITPGTYENAAPYVHAGLFGIAALFRLGESDLAWRETERAMVLTHPDCTKTPFVMPNSYCDCEAYNMHGESMGDWYTGSGAVLIKNLIRYGFGIAPDLDGVHLQTAACMPCHRAHVSLCVKGHPLTLRYERQGGNTRRILLNGTACDTVFDPLLNTYTAFIPTNQLTDNIIIDIID